MRRIFACLLALSCFQSFAQDIKDVYYSSKADDVSRQFCKLDVYNIGESGEKKPVLVWFHGGGITSGDKRQLPSPIVEKNYGVVVVSANYRLSPKIKAHQAIDDAAEAVAWVYNNAEKIGADKRLIFVCGHSAGGYLAGMVGFSPKYLQGHGIKNTDLAGLVLLSAQATKHFQVRKDLGDKSSQYLPVIDELSILGNAGNKAPPLCIIVGDKRLEWKCRVEENFLLEATVRTLGSCPYTEIFQLQGTNHGTCAVGFAPIAKSFIKKVQSQIEK